MAEKLHSPCQHSMMPSRLLTAGLTAAILPILPLAQAQEKTDPPQAEDPTQGSLPTLDILPEGSILRRVRIPRYDKDFNPTSLLSAETLTVLDGERIDGLGITIELYGKDGSVEARTKMRHAIYNQKRSTLHASEAVFVQGKNYVASGTGLVFHWKTNRGFLLGPASTKFKQTTPTKSTAMKLNSSHPSLSVASSLIALTGFSTSLLAEPPKRLTSEQLAELDQLNRPMKHQVEALQQTTRGTVEEDLRMNSEADSVMGPFLKRIGQSSLLVQKAGTDKETKKPTEVEDKPSTDESGKAADDKAPAPKAAAPVPTLKVECDGGLYFDTDTGILAYLKNVRLTEPRFKLTCSDELKVFLAQKPAKKAEPAKSDKTTEKATETDQSKSAETATPPTTEKKDADAKKPAKEEEEDAKKDDGLAGFGDLKRIIATGKVKVTRKDENGNLFIATAESASYDASTGEMILRGGLPRLQTGPNQYLQSLAPGQYIRILGNGKFITEGKWRMETPTKTTTPKKKPATPRKKTP
ncbi:hypothetical protein NT6N_14080 [Oceaniferula spumae]|uniref:Organic solvent tolerance-like N-terminal domain-containing protein n=1 Tax=Oceaniferula spumae TaxID=2979115 RepID=A0AAT9FK36_9BACT